MSFGKLLFDIFASGPQMIDFFFRELLSRDDESSNY